MLVHAAGEWGGQVCGRRAPLRACSTCGGGATVVVDGHVHIPLRRAGKLVCQSPPGQPGAAFRPIMAVWLPVCPGRARVRRAQVEGGRPERVERHLVPGRAARVRRGRV